MSWGNRLLIVFVVFGAGMIYLVFRSMQISTELVETDYYQKELVYQNQLEASSRGAKAGGVTVQTKAKDIEFTWPATQRNMTLTGEAWFYCAYDKKQDRRIPIQTNNGNLQIDKSQLAPGRYTVKLNWSDGQETFYQENSIDIPE